MKSPENSMNEEIRYDYIDENDSKATLFFDLDEQGNLVKLGDGTFGVIYKAHNLADTESYAVKLFYQSKQDTKIAKERFEREAGVSRLIRSHLKEKGGARDLGGTVEIHGKIMDFEPSGKLEEAFHRAGIEVSSYALVMDLYDFTLKDLLEIGPDQKKRYVIEHKILEDSLSSSIPKELDEDYYTEEDALKRLIDGANIDEQTKSKLKDGIVSKPVGYELLKSLAFNDRIRTALPYLYYIAVGLKHLHEVPPHEGPLFHYDIKPANILVRLDASHGFVCALGDIGFLKPNSWQGQSFAPDPNDLPLGTLHYRSPEQKEFFDVANVVVRVSKDQDSNQSNQGTTRTILTVKDPKFNEGFIEPGDYVVFSKDAKRTPYTIKHIKPGDGRIPAQVEITADESVVGSDEQTQAVFYKWQGHRTDLFGVGAVAFDMITCGSSPERFYEDIRRFEIGTSGRGPGDVGTIMQKYSRVKNGQAQADEPSLIQIFKPFKHHVTSEYAPEDIVRLILKCMLYKARGTFYNLAFVEDKDESKAVERLITEIIELQEQEQYRPKPKENALITLRGKFPNPKRSQYLEEIIRRLQEPDHAILHLVEAAHYFMKLTELLRDIASEVSNGNVLYQMLPSNIDPTDNPKSPFRFISLTYKDESEYKTDLKSGAIEKIYRLVESPFVPNQVAFMRRDMLLSVPMTKTSDNRTPNIADEVVDYKFIDSSPFGSMVNVGDWIVMEENQWLFRVTEVKNGRQMVLRPEVAESKIPPGKTQAVYYAHIDPPKYYLDMLALYLHDMFLAYSPITTETRDKIDMQGLILQRSDRTISKPLPPKGSLLRKANLSLQHIYQYIAYLYLRLSDHSSSDSYYEEDKSNFSRIILAVNNDARTLLNMVEAYLGIPVNSYDAKPPKDEKEIVQEVGEDKFREKEEDFNKLSKSPLDIQDMMRKL